MTAVLLEKFFQQRCGLDTGGQRRVGIHSWASVTLVEMKNKARRGGRASRLSN